MNHTPLEMTPAMERECARKIAQEYKVDDIERDPRVALRTLFAFIRDEVLEQAALTAERASWIDDRDAIAERIRALKGTP